MEDGHETDVSARTAMRVEPAAAGSDVPAAPPPASEHSDFIHNARHMLHEWRRAAIHTMPPFVVNNATNFIGTAQLLAEVLMLKSAGIKFLENTRQPGGKPNFLIDPIYNLWCAASRRQPELHYGPPHKNTSAINIWQARATLAGIAAWTMGALLPNRQETEQQVDDAVRQYHQSPGKYFFNKFQHGFYLFNPDYKREQVGLGVTTAGIFSALSGMGSMGRKTNIAHTFGGLITASAGALLWFSPTAEQGWRRFGSTLWARLTTVPFNIRNRYINKDFWGYYSGAQTMFTGSSVAAYMLGGAEKKADGTIIDHTEIRRQANKKYGGYDAYAAGLDDVPSASITQVVEHQAKARDTQKG